MATVIPPPSKRQKLDIAERAREQQQNINEIPQDLGNIRIQFFDHATGKATGGPVLVPVADATVKNLELLVNSIQGNVRLRSSRFNGVLTLRIHRASQSECPIGLLFEGIYQTDL